MSGFFWRGKPRRKSDRERGQSLVEMTLGMTILLLLISGLLDLGRIYFIFLTLEDAAGEAALYLSIDPECTSTAAGTGGECADPNNAVYRAKTAGAKLVDLSTSTVTITPANAALRDQIGETVSVNIAYQFTFLTPIMPSIAGINPITITGSATQILTSDVD